MSVKKIVRPLALLPLLGATCAVQAQSYNMYGVVDLSFGSFQYSAAENTAAAKAVTKVEGNQMVTSFIGLKGSEDLGDGMKAGFALESFLRPDVGGSGRTSADVFWARAANVWLSSSLGTVTIGRQGNMLFGQVAGFNPFGGAFGLSPAVRLTYGSWGNDKGDSAWSNGASYSTPDMGGFVGSVQTQAGETSDSSQGSSYALGGKYASGPFAIAAGWQTVRSATAPKPVFAVGQRQTFGLINASFDAVFAKFYGEFGQIANSGFATTARITTNLYQLGAAVPVTKESKVLVSFGQSKEKPVEGGTTPVTLHNIFTVGYDYWLSKRTDTYVAYMMDNEKLTGFKKGNTFAAGLRVAF